MKKRKNNKNFWEKNQRPSKERIKQIEEFCKEHNITHNSNYDSFYFEIKGQQYRISNHSIDDSVHRDKKTNKLVNHHIDGNEIKNSHEYCSQVKCYYAFQSRLEYIYNDIVKGYQLDNNGRRK